MKNMRRAANRRGGRPEGREPEHNEAGFRSNNSAKANFGSPASRGSMGSGSVAGAGEQAGNWVGPGPLTRRLQGMPSDMYASQVGSSARPQGMDVIAQGEGPKHPRRNG